MPVPRRYARAFPLVGGEEPVLDSTLDPSPPVRERRCERCSCVLSRYAAIAEELCAPCYRAVDESIVGRIRSMHVVGGSDRALERAKQEVIAAAPHGLAWRATEAGGKGWNGRA